MEEEKKFGVLFHILSSEQQILQRTDQKAFTLISLIGVFTVFFIIHYTKLEPSTFNLIFIALYFIAVLFSLTYLVIVISPRIGDVEEKIREDNLTVSPTFFGGIVKYKSPDEYLSILGSVLDNSGSTYSIFAKSIYSIGIINARKNKFLRFGIYWFVLAIAFEFLIIVSLYFRMVIY